METGLVGPERGGGGRKKQQQELPLNIRHVNGQMSFVMNESPSLGLPLHYRSIGFHFGHFFFCLASLLFNGDSDRSKRNSTTSIFLRLLFVLESVVTEHRSPSVKLPQWGTEDAET